jgi:hypothetical protein
VSVAVAGDTAVLSMSAGQLAAVVPGSARVRYFVDGQQCDADSDVWVSPDLLGIWAAACDNGDTGQFTVTQWPRTVLRWNRAHGASGGGTGFVTAVTDGRSCFVSADGEFSCDNVDRSAGVRFSPYLPGGGAGAPIVACAPDRPCAGVQMSSCGRHARTWETLGPDELRLVGEGPHCRVVRGAGECKAADCAGEFLAIANTLICDGHEYGMRIIVSDGMASYDSGWDSGVVSVADDCSVVIPDSTAVCPQAPSTISLTDGGSCTMGYGFSFNGVCECSGLVECTISKVE